MSPESFTACDELVLDTKSVFSNSVPVSVYSVTSASDCLSMVHKASTEAGL